MPDEPIPKFNDYVKTRPAPRPAPVRNWESDVNPELVPHAKRIMSRLQSEGYDVRIGTTKRSVDEQLKVMAAGNSRVKNPRNSRHVTDGQPSNALDLIIYENGKPDWQAKSPGWKIIGDEARGSGLGWGGDIEGLYDPGHIQVGGGLARRSASRATQTPVGEIPKFEDFAKSQGLSEVVVPESSKSLTETLSLGLQKTPEYAPQVQRPIARPAFKTETVNVLERVKAKKGETITDIASRYKIGTRELAQLNGRGFQQEFKGGEEVRVPTTRTIRKRVRGRTLYGGSVADDIAVDDYVNPRRPALTLADVKRAEDTDTQPVGMGQVHRADEQLAANEKQFRSQVRQQLEAQREKAVWEESTSDNPDTSRLKPVTDADVEQTIERMREDAPAEGERSTSDTIAAVLGVGLPSVTGNLYPSANGVTAGQTGFGKEGNRLVQEGVTRSVGGTLQQVGNLVQRVPVVGSRNNTLQRAGRTVQSGAQKSIEANPSDSTLGELRDELVRGSAALPLEYGKLAAGSPLGALNLPLQGIASANPDNPDEVAPAIIKGLGYHYGMGITAPLGKFGNALFWTALPAAESKLANPDESWAKAIGGAIPFGTLAFGQHPVEVKENGHVRRATVEDSEAIKSGKLEIVPPESVLSDPSVREVVERNRQQRAENPIEMKAKTIIRHADPRIDGGEVIRKVGDKIEVRNNEGGVSVVQNPRTRGNRNAAIQKVREGNVETQPKELKPAEISLLKGEYDSIAPRALKPDGTPKRGARAEDIARLHEIISQVEGHKQAVRERKDTEDRAAAEAAKTEDIARLERAGIRVGDEVDAVTARGRERVKLLGVEGEAADYSNSRPRAVYKLKVLQSGREIALPSSSGLRLELPAEPLQRGKQNDGVSGSSVRGRDVGRRTADIGSAASPLEKPIVEPTVEPTGTKVSVTRTEREARGLNPVEKQAYQAIGQAYEVGKESVESGKVDARSLAQSIAEKPRVLSADEVGALGFDRARLINEHRQAIKDISDAVDAKNENAINEGRTRLERIEQALDFNDQALERGGREQSAAFNARKMLVRDDYSLASVIQKAKAKSGKDLTPESRVRFENWAKELEAKESELIAREEAVKKGEAAKATERIKRDVALESRRLGRAATKVDLDTQFAQLSTQFSTRLENRLNANPLDPELIKIIGQMAKNRVRAGITSVEGLVDEIHAKLKDYVEDKRDIRDAISGYGKTAEMSKDQLDVQLRDMRRQMRLISAIEDAEGGQRPARSGLVREKESGRAAELRKQLNETLKAQGLRQAADPLPAAKKRLESQIADIEKQLEQGTRNPRVRRQLNYDKEATELKAKRDALKAQLDKEYPKPTVERDPLPAIKNRLQKQIAEFEGKIQRGEYAKAPKREPVEYDRAATQLKAERDKLKKQIDNEIEKLENPYLYRLRRGGRVIAEAGGLQRQLMSGVDFSAALTHGGMFTVGHPIKAAPVLARSIMAFGSERVAERTIDKIKSDPVYSLMEKAGVEITDWRNPDISKHEEGMMNRFFGRVGEAKVGEQPTTARKVGLVGLKALTLPYTGSERAFTVFMNGVRAGLFKRYLSMYPEIANDTKKLQSVGKLVNILSGRGELGRLKTIAPELNLLMYSARYTASAWQTMIAPVSPRGTNVSRKAAAREIARFIASAAAIQAAGQLAGAWTCDNDPRSSEFGKCRIAGTNTTFNLLGRFQAPIRYTAQFLTGQTVNPQTRAVTELKGMDQFKPVVQYGRSRLSPAASLAVDWKTGKDMAGKDFAWGNAIVSRLTPMNVRDIVEAVQEQQRIGGSPATMVGEGVLSTFGGGLLTKDAPASKGRGTPRTFTENESTERTFTPRN
jgi:LysM domain